MLINDGNDNQANEDTMLDSDDAALAEALKDVEAESAAGAAGGDDGTGADAAGDKANQGGAAAEGADAAGDKGNKTDGGDGDPGADGQDRGGDGRVPHPVVGELRNKLRQRDEALTKAEARLEIVRDLVKTGNVSAEALEAILGDKSAAGGLHEVETDPFADINARELQLAKQLDDGDIGHVEYRRQMQALELEKLEINRQIIRKENEEAQSNAVLNRTRTAAKKIHEVFPILGKITQEDLESCRPIVARTLAARVEQQFGRGVRYDQNNDDHVNLLRWMLAETADKVFGEGKGPVKANGGQQQKQNGADGKPLSSNQINGSDAAKQAASRAAAGAANRQPPDMQSFAFAEDSDLGKIERAITNGSMSEEEIGAWLKAHPAEAAKLEGRA